VASTADLIRSAVERVQAEAPALVTAILEAVRKFSAGEQEDDITLVAARCR